jgi:hypothetical protein
MLISGVFGSWGWGGSTTSDGYSEVFFSIMSGIRALYFTPAFFFCLGGCKRYPVLDLIEFMRDDTGGICQVALVNMGTSRA